MKLRMGFVSNSSSSSFCIYGVQQYKMPNSLRVKAGKLGLCIHESESHDVYVGLEPATCKDSMTVGELKRDATELIKQVFGSPQECGWICGEYDIHLE